MKLRMAKPGERYRFMARSSNPHTLSRLENLMAAEGYKRVKFLSFLAHIINFEYTIRTGIVTWRSFLLNHNEETKAPPEQTPKAKMLLATKSSKSESSLGLQVF